MGLSLTTQDAALDLLGLMGVENLSFAGTPTLNRILSDINAELQHLWTIAPQWYSTETTGEVIRAPQTVTGITAYFGDKTITIPSVESWMLGSTILLDGDQFQNQILHTVGSTVTLARPYAGPTGSGKTAKVWNDAFVLYKPNCGVLPPVILLGHGELIGLNGKRDLRRFSSNSIYSTNHGLSGQSVAVSQNLDEGRPLAYLVESYTENPSMNVVMRMRLAPLPNTNYVLEYQAKREAPRVAEINTTTEIPVPQQYVESVFMPLLRKRFSTWKNFNSNGINMRLDEQFRQALAILAKLKPQAVSSRTVGVRPGW